jgi:hypothetical protein
VRTEYIPYDDTFEQKIERFLVLLR